MKVHIMWGMNKLPIVKRAQILSLLCEGMGAIIRKIHVGPAVAAAIRAGAKP